MSRIAAIHATRRDLGLDDGAYRSLLVRVTGKASLRDMNEREQGRVLTELRSKDSRSAAIQGPYGAKLQALWISGYQLGVFNNPDDAALVAFVLKQTKVSHTRFLREAATAMRAVEALKGWIAREAGIDWSVGLPDGRQEVDRVIGRQLAIIAKDLVAAAELAADSALLARAAAWEASPLGREDAHALANALGRIVRAGK